MQRPVKELTPDLMPLSLVLTITVETPCSWKTKFLGVYNNFFLLLDKIKCKFTVKGDLAYIIHQKKLFEYF